jgi:hypothetical protein
MKRDKTKESDEFDNPMDKHFAALFQQIPVPEFPEEMDYRFMGMLETEKHSLIGKLNWRKILVSGITNIWRTQPQLKLTYALLIACIFLIIGSISNQHNKKELNQMSLQIENMRELMLFSLVDNPSASKRLQAVSYSGELENLNDKVIGVLFTALNEDPNINVRIATLESLLKYSDNPKVRAGLVNSITQQESPLVQSAMVDAMVKLQEKSSVKQFRQLLNRKDLNNSVKTKIETSILQLI